jgi:hypothetical protein
MASRALIIGPAEYAADSGINSYPEIARSAEQYGEVLRADTRCWGPDRVEVLSPDRLGSVVDVMDAVQAAADEAGRDPGSTLLIVYVGHGVYWNDVPGGAEVHFAVGSSRLHAPFTWLSSWYVYRAMRNCNAARKVLIADCCHSNRLGHLGGARAADAGDTDGLLRGVLREVYQGSCVLTAARENPKVDASGCTNSQLPARFRACTPFSGHLLNVLDKGTTNKEDELTLGMLRDAVERDMNVCGRHGNTLRMVLSDAREHMPLFANRMPADDRVRVLPDPGGPEEWAEMIVTKSGYSLDPLLADPEKTGKVVALLARRPESSGPRLAEEVNEAADATFREPAQFARYWYWAQATQTLAA